MQNPLVQQLEKRADVLAVVKERILTTNSCSITQTKKEQCTFQGVLWLLGMLGNSVNVCVGGVECVCVLGNSENMQKSMLQFQCDADQYIISCGNVFKIK